MPPFGDRFARGLKHLTRDGQTVTLTRHTQTGNATAANPNGTETTSKVSAKALVLGYRQHEIDGTSVQTGDRKVLIAPADIGNTPPDTSDKIKIGAQDFAIIDVKRIEPQGTPAMYVVQAR